LKTPVVGSSVAPELGQVGGAAWLAYPLIERNFGEFVRVAIVGRNVNPLENSKNRCGSQGVPNDFGGVYGVLEAIVHPYLVPPFLFNFFTQRN
jgi:hypothetical protein